MTTLDMWERMKRLPGGTRLFSHAIGLKAPYFRSIRAHVEDLGPGRARVTMRKRRAVENHLKTVHAIAMCNMAELAGGLMTEVSIPAGARWIPSGMTVEYLKKAKTDLTAVSEGGAIDWTKEGDVVVPIHVYDAGGAEVFRARISMNLKQGASRKTPK